MEAKHIKVVDKNSGHAGHAFKALGPALALLSVLAASLYLWGDHSHVAAPVKPAAVKFKTIPARRGDIEQIVLATGKLQLFHYVDLGSQISGEISDVRVAVGDEVKSGKSLLKIAPMLSAARLEANQAQLAALRAGLAEQQAQLEFAELQFKRQTQLKADNATREESFESSRAALASAEARLEAIKAHIRETESATRDDEENSKHTELTAPISGTVIAVSARPGEAVTARQQIPALVRIADLSKLTVQARVAEIDVPRLHEGMTAYFSTPGFPGKRWYGKVRQVVPVPADGSGEQGKATFYNVLFEVGNPERLLLSGMTTDVSFVTASAHDATTIPVALLSKPDGDGWYDVNVLDANQRVQSRRVQVGIRNHDQAQILSGLTPGEQLVIDEPQGPALNLVSPAHKQANDNSLGRNVPN